MTEPAKPKRMGFGRLEETVGLSLLLSWGGAFYEDYSYQRKIKYLDVRLVFFRWMLWAQIPLKRYGIRGVA